ncbi:DUF397 domain-containing protein [Streptomyces albipurpureus]|uniref:DUF397 domain-containing protein n=1 Tax=Streptomyces albipurpureus TaxID=2897419 RepID=A0ABT0UGZ6_9ACTN|nr:DUF397 domain-containing protein [Streptomyces sp. CWNU-1]MCM2387309.1 DUF397 domain-containing protein [Streptomyces sp. CWNU-1]
MSESEPCWFKSSYSSAQGDDCVEVAVMERVVRVRDSKDVTCPHIAVDHKGWAQFIEYAARS